MTRSVGPLSQKEEIILILTTESSSLLPKRGEIRAFYIPLFASAELTPCPPRNDSVGRASLAKRGDNLNTNNRVKFSFAKEGRNTCLLYPPLCVSRTPPLPPARMTRSVGPLSQKEEIILILTTESSSLLPKRGEIRVFYIPLFASAGLTPLPPRPNDSVGRASLAKKRS